MVDALEMLLSLVQLQNGVFETVANIYFSRVDFHLLLTLSFTGLEHCHLKVCESKTPMTIRLLEVESCSLETLLDFLSYLQLFNFLLNLICLFRIELYFKDVCLTQCVKSPDVAFEDFRALSHSEVVLLNHGACKIVLFYKNKVGDVVDHQAFIS